MDAHHLRAVNGIRLALDPADYWRLTARLQACEIAALTQRLAVLQARDAETAKHACLKDLASRSPDYQADGAHYDMDDAACVLILRTTGRRADP
jgi:hypothetical protein